MKGVSTARYDTMPSSDVGSCKVMSVGRGPIGMDGIPVPTPPRVIASSGMRRYDLTVVRGAATSSRRAMTVAISDEFF